MLNRGMVLSGTAIACVAAMMPGTAYGQTRSFDIPAQPVRSAVIVLGSQADVQIVAARSVTRRALANPVRGTMSVEAALRQMLRGTGLTARKSTDSAYAIVRESAPTGTDASALTLQTEPPAAPGGEPGTSPRSTEQPEGEVVVTGSRIRRESFDTASPVSSFSGEEIAESGRVELSEVLTELPSVNSTLGDGTNTGDVQNDGLSSIQLRNLGDNRTLVLVDGRRTVSNSANGNRVSLSTIPNDFVRRVDISTGGTSSVYGSDAVAGVVNIITETKRTGFRLGGRGELTDAGGGGKYLIDASLGTKFADKRGYFLVAGTYDKQQGLRASQRDFAQRQVDYDWDAGVNEYDTLFKGTDGAPTSGDQPVGTFPPNVQIDLSNSPSGGVFWGPVSSRNRFYRGSMLVPLGPDVQTGAAVNVGTTDPGNSGYFVTQRDGESVREYRSLRAERERYLGAAKVDFALSDQVSLFAQAQYSRIKTLSFREPSTVAHDDVFFTIDPDSGTANEFTLGRIPCTGVTNCNPFVPLEIRRDMTARGVSFRRRITELGPQYTRNDRETIRGWAGAHGDAWGDWKWDASFSYGQFTQDQIRGGELNYLALQQGLDATTVNGQIVCRNRSNGCVPVNLFGENSISPEALDFIRVDLSQRARVEQQGFLGYLSGSLLKLPAGPVGAAFGIEYRKDQQKITGDLLSRIGGTSGPPVPNFGGSISVFEGFGEISVPILKDIRWAKSLSVDASVRVGEYDIRNVGTVFSFRGGVQYAPSRDIRFRGSFARSQRAPDLTELFSPPRGDVDDVSDICSGVTPTTTGRVAANCRADPGIQALFASQAVEGVRQIYQQSGLSIYSPNAGNLDLKEETADTFTVGAVATPSFLRRLTLSVDYYDINVKDAITAYDNADILAECYDSDLTPATNRFCGDVRRNPNNGQILVLTQRQFNLNNFRTSGIDVAAEYRFNLRDIGIPGNWTVRYDATHLLKYVTRYEGLAGLVTNDQRGELTNRTFKYRARASLGWRRSGLSLRYTAILYGKIYDDLRRLREYQDFAATNPNAEYPLFLKIPAITQHNFNGSYNFDLGKSSNLRIFGGVINIFNQISPFLPTGDVINGGTTNYNPNYDSVGRRFYFGAEIRF